MTKRRGLQTAALALAAVIVLHGFLGPDLAPRNLATLLVWVHIRGLLVLALLAFGNVFCMACPFTLVRDWTRRLTAPTRRWPRALRTKAPAVLLFVAVLFAYERWSLWSTPAGTAGLVLAYFAAAALTDSFFTGAPFCKWVCPLGQFNFAASALSPFEVAAKDLAVCASCRTKDCLRGRRDESGAVLLRGCELGLFLPRKAANMDCTFCMDCVAACPVENAGLVTRIPGAELFTDGFRSGVGRPSSRLDLGALSAVFMFGGLLNAFAMTGPAYAAADRLGGLPGLFLVGLGAAPLLLLAAAAAFSRRAAPAPLAATALRYAPSLIPLGTAVWTSHYLFHFLTGALTIVPAVQAAAVDLFGMEMLGRPLWGLAGIPPVSAQGVGQGLLLLGLLGSCLSARRLAQEAAPARPAAAAAPWFTLAILLYAAAAWVMVQPMEMRGVFPS